MVATFDTLGVGMGDVTGDLVVAAIHVDGIVLLSLAVGLVVLLAAWRHRRRAVLRDAGDLAATSGTAVAGVLTPSHGGPGRPGGPGRTDTPQSRRLLTAVTTALDEGPATVLVVGSGRTSGAGLAATLARAAEGRGDAVTLLRAPPDDDPAHPGSTMLEYDLSPAWFAGDAPDADALDLLEHVETEDDGQRTVVVAAPPASHAGRGLAPLVDATVVVAELGVTRRVELVETLAELADAGAETVLVAAVESPSSHPVRDRRPAVGVAGAVALTLALNLALLFLLPRLVEPGPGARTGTTGEDAQPDGRSAPAPARGPGRGRAGIHVTATAEASGTVGVVEQVLAASPVRSVVLAPPPRPDDATQAPQLLDVRVVADGVAVAVVDDVSDAAGETVRLPAPATRLEVTYELVGADVRSATAPPGRATLTLRPATHLTFADLAVVTELVGGGVLTLVCPDVPRQRRLCGLDEDTGWRTRPVPAPQSAVVALVDLGTTG